MTQYEFVNCWPTNVTSMRVAYGDSNVLKCNVQFAYDRFFTEFTRQGDHRQFAIESPLAESKELSETQALVNRDNRIYGDTFPTGTTITSNQSNITSGLKGFKTEVQHDAYGPGPN